MFARRWIAVLAILGHSVVAFGSNVDGISLSHHEPLERIIVRSHGVAFAQKPASLGPVQLSFDALGRTFELQLEPNAALLAAIAADGDAGNAIPYRGRIAGSPNSWARIVITDGMPAGIVWDGQSLYAIEIPGDSVVDTATPLIFRLADALVAPGALSCASAAMTTDGGAVYKSLVRNLGVAMAQGPGAVSEINVGTVGDFEFTDAKGANAQTAIITRMNNVDGIFSQQLGVQINVPVIDTFPASNDPFTDTNDSGDLLVELGAYRLNTPNQVSQGLTHLWTGRDLAGMTVGIAYTGALCSPGFGAGLSEGNGGATFDSLIAAHEIGHNFGAPHDAVPGPCVAEAPDFIMATTLNGSDQFSSCSIAEMQDDIAAASCITPLPSTDISIRYNSAPPTILLSNAATVTFDVVNNGTEPAVNVIADITLPSNVAFIAASSSTATCTNGSGMVNCQFGNVAGGSATTVTVSADTTSVGVGSFDATVVADTDDNVTNNQASAVLTVDPAVNLAVTAPAQPRIDLNQSTTVSATMQNLAVLDATGVTLNVTLGAGLRADSATWSLGNCTVAAQQVDCVATQFDNQSSSTLSLGLTGTAAGTKTYTITLASIEADADPADNSVAASVRVNGGSNDDSGGGGLGLLFLALLGCSLLRGRQRETR